MGSGGEIAGEVLFGHGSFAMCFLLSFRKQEPSHNREVAPATIKKVRNRQNDFRQHRTKFFRREFSKTVEMVPLS